MTELESLEKNIVSCTKCPRLRNHCQEIARKKRRAFQNEIYWGKPVPGFGDSNAKILIVGLAPAAHGANRTGRMFTGDRSGDWLYRALHKAGLANQAKSVNKTDGLQLKHTFISAAARCAPPQNKPFPEEIENCIPYLKKEIEIFQDIKVFIVLGQIALFTLWPLLKEKSKRPKFVHAGEFPLQNGRQTLIMSYHPSQQNTFTGRLTEEMFDEVFNKAVRAFH